MGRFIDYCLDCAGTGRGPFEFVPPWTARTDVVDGLRVALDMQPVGNAQPAWVRGEIYGLHENDVVRVHFVYGAFAPGGPHQIRTINGVSELSVQGPGTTSWAEYDFQEPIDATYLKLVKHTWFWWDGTASSMTTEFQLLLDDMTYLALDDAYSPSRGSPPDEVRGSTTHLLLLDEPQRQAISHNEIIGWRWRINCSSGSVRCFRPDTAITFEFFYEFDDCNCNTIPDCTELESGQAQDANGNGILD